MKLLTHGIRALAMLALTTLPHLTLAQPQTPKQFGVHVRNDNNPLPNNWGSLVQQSGSSLVRIPIAWGWFELEGKGQTPSWFWPTLDNMVNQASSHGQQVLITLFSTPCWATVDYAGKDCSPAVLSNGTWKYNMPPAKTTDFADALKRIAQHYNSVAPNVVVAYEIWNEPNIITFWANTKRRTIPFEFNNGYPFFVDQASARAYTQLVIAGYDAVKAVNPRLTVIAGSISDSDTYFLDEMYKAGAKNHFDALSIHPYPNVTQASYHPFYGRAANANDCFNFSAIPTEGCLKQAVEIMHTKMLSYNDNKPLWFTEFGISSTPDWGGAGGIAHSLAAAEKAQSEEAFKMIHLTKSWDFVDTAIWYELINRPKTSDYATNNWTQPEPFFGLYREDSSAKPVFSSYRAAINANPQPIQLYPSGDIPRPTYTSEFRWQAVPQATGYVIWLNYQSNPVQNGKIDRYVTAAQANCATGYECKLSDTTAFANNITSRWWVKAFFADGSTRDSNPVDFKLRASNVPVLLAPKQNTVVTTSATNNAPTFSWKPVANAAQYYFWMRGYYPFGIEHPDQTGDETIYSTTLTPAQANCSGVACRYLPPNLSLGYSPSTWTVTAIMSNGQAYTAPMQGFTLYPSKTVFMKPAQIEPEGIINTTKPSYVWTPTARANSYRLWVNGSNGAGIVNLVIPSSACNTGTCRYTPNIAVGSGDATWWITALTATGQAAVSDGMTFRSP